MCNAQRREDGAAVIDVEIADAKGFVVASVERGYRMYLRLRDRRRACEVQGARLMENEEGGYAGAGHKSR